MLFPQMELHGKTARKETGAYYTPDEVAASLVSWAVRHEMDEMLDPACGDGIFLAQHPRSTGIEQNELAISGARKRAPAANTAKAEFFSWAGETDKRFDCAAGNPPFIRYQRFNGEVRRKALDLCHRLGARFSSLTSSWAPFLVVAASLLKRGGRMAFVVPAEIGHAPYAVPLLRFLLDNFELLQVVAVREKVFSALSEDCWLLYAEGYGGNTNSIRLSAVENFSFTSTPPDSYELVSAGKWLEEWNGHLRPFLLRREIRELYRAAAQEESARRLGEVAQASIGYVTGANDFFHLRPSTALKYDIPQAFLHPAVRNGRMLNARSVTDETVQQWLNRDEAVLLLRIPKDKRLPASVSRYLNTQKGKTASRTYKCRNRKPWYVVPDVSVPDGFLTYMSHGDNCFAANRARCVCTNSVHAVKLKNGISIEEILKRWSNPLRTLSCEIEGHPLGGGLLKMEPREAARIILPASNSYSPKQIDLINEGITSMRRWRHCDKTT